MREKTKGGSERKNKRRKGVKKKRRKRGKNEKNMKEKTRDIGNSFYNSIQAMKQ